MSRQLTLEDVIYLSSVLKGKETFCILCHKMFSDNIGTFIGPSDRWSPACHPCAEKLAKKCGACNTLYITSCPLMHESQFKVEMLKNIDHVFLSLAIKGKREYVNEEGVTYAKSNHPNY